MIIINKLKYKKKIHFCIIVYPNIYQLNICHFIKCIQHTKSLKKYKICFFSSNKKQFSFHLLLLPTFFWKWSGSLGNRFCTFFQSFHDQSIRALIVGLFYSSVLWIAIYGSPRRYRSITEYGHRNTEQSTRIWEGKKPVDCTNRIY